MKHRKILHLDLDAFFCAVEEGRDPSLRGKAFAVGGRPDERGVVASCSYAARRFGVRSAMPMSRALKLCPGLLIVPSHHKAYQAVSQKVMARLGALTPLVEQISIDEAFLDVTDLPESGETLARQLQALIRDELGLPCSVGVAANKLIAKIATDVGKAASQTGGHRPPQTGGHRPPQTGGHRPPQTGGYPNAIMVVPPGQEAAFLAPLPAQTLWGVGPKTADALASLGIHTIGDLARWPSADLARRFGKVGVDLAGRARGLDDRPVVTGHEAKSISQETTFARDVKDGKALRDTLRDLSDQVGRRLRQSGLSGATVKLKLRWPDFTTLTRQTTLSQPADQGDEIYNAVTRLFDDVWRAGKAVRLLGVAVTGLGTSVQQLSLLDEGSEKKRRLQTAIDELRERFGSRAVQRASQLKDEE